MLVTFNGLVVREVKNGDSSKLITIITDTHGRILMSAKGIGSIKNQNSSACGMFCYSEFVTYYKNGKYTLKSAHLIRNCIKHNGSLEELALATYITELADNFARGEPDTSSIMQYCINALHILYKGDRPRRMIKAIYELRLLSAAGYMPDIECCAVCGCDLRNFNGVYFCIVDGVFTCRDCHTENYIKKQFISSNCFKLICYVISAPESKAYAVKLQENTQKEFCDVCQDFLLAQLEKKPETLDFYNTIEENDGKL